MIQDPARNVDISCADAPWQATFWMMKSSLRRCPVPKSWAPRLRSRWNNRRSLQCKSLKSVRSTSTLAAKKSWCIIQSYIMSYICKMVTRIFARPHTKSPVAVAVWRRIHLKFTSFDKKLHHWEQVQQLESCDSRSILAPLTLSERGIMLCAVLLCISSSAICASWIPCISSLAFLLGAKDRLELSWNEICCCSASPVSGSPWTGLLRCSTNPSGWLMSPKFYHYDQLRASIKAWFPVAFFRLLPMEINWLLSTAFHCHCAAGWLNQRNRKRSDSWSYSIPSFSHLSSLIFTDLHWSSLNVFICIMIFMRMLPWALHL